MLKKARFHLKNHLLPTKHNGFVPNLLRERQVWAMLGIGLAMFAFVQSARITNYFGLPAEVYPAVVFSLTNADRAEENLPLLSLNETLSKAAKLKADDMASKGYFAHTSPDGITPWHWFAQAGYKFIYAGENLAVNFDDSKTVQAAWLDSPTHRANIMNANFTEIGIATATGFYNGKETTFVVETFGSPASVKVASVQATTPTATSAPKPTPVAQATPKPAPSPQPTSVAGETQIQTQTQTAAPRDTIKIVDETDKFISAYNEDETLEASAPTAPVSIPQVKWYQRLVLKSGDIAGIIIQVIMVVVIISVAGIVAKEYEKRHMKHAIYGALVAVIMFAALFVGRIGIFSYTNSRTASAVPVVDMSPRSEYSNGW